MATYLIGDVQGCFDELMLLLDKIAFNPKQDQLGFVGDLVNRGPKSLDVLRFVSSLKNPLVVLGNHDLYLLALAFTDLDYPAPHTLQPILDASDKHDLLEWLAKQPLMLTDPEKKLILSHAGIPPQWTAEQAQCHADEIGQQLKPATRLSFLTHLFGNSPTQWSENLTGMERYRYICNAFTRMRFCQADGTLNLKNKTNQSDSANEKPWFELTNPSLNNWTVFFGHWATLHGQCRVNNIFALDEGCAWGHSLCAFKLEDRSRIRVFAQSSDDDQ